MGKRKALSACWGLCCLRMIPCSLEKRERKCKILTEEGSVDVCVKGGNRDWVMSREKKVVAFRERITFLGDKLERFRISSIWGIILLKMEEWMLKYMRDSRYESCWHRKEENEWMEAYQKVKLCLSWCTGVVHGFVITEWQRMQAVCKDRCPMAKMRRRRRRGK